MLIKKIRSDLDFWQTISNILSTLLSGLAIVLSVWIYMKVNQDSQYQNFDEMYMNLLQVGLDNPEFRDAAQTANYKTAYKDKSLVQYETYAYMCWNFCETLYDKGDEELLKTWLSAIEVENTLHQNWFDAPENKDKYKDEFRDYIHKTFSKK